MKKWFAVSLSLNFILLGILIKHPAHPDVEAGVPVPAVSGEKTESKPVAEFVPAIKTRASGLRDWIDLLRNAGAPDSLLATLVQADFDQRWQSRAAEVQKRYANNEADINDLALLNSAHETDLEKEMENMLGLEGFKAWDEARQFSDINLTALNLTSAETDILYQLHKRRQGQFRAAEIAKGKKDIDQAEYDSRHEAADAEYQQQLRLLLGYERYNLVKGSGIPADVEHTLKEMNVGQDQLAGVEDIQHKSNDRQAELEQKVETGELNQAGFEEQMQVLRDWQQEQTKSVLGTNAFSYFQKQQDPRYANMQSFASGWGISSQDVEHVYSTLTHYDQTVQNYKLQISACEANGDSTKEDELKASLQSFSSQTSRLLLQDLGQNRFNILKNNHILPFN